MLVLLYSAGSDICDFPSQTAFYAAAFTFVKTAREREGKTTNLDDGVLAERSSSSLESQIGGDDSKYRISVLEPGRVAGIDDGSREVRFGNG